MNLDSMPRPETIHVSAPASLSRPALLGASQTMPQRSPFAIQELLGLNGSGSTSTNPAGSGNGGNGNGNAEHSLQHQHHQLQQQRNNVGNMGPVSISGPGGLGNGAGGVAGGTSNSVTSSATSTSLYPSVGQTPFSSDHHQMTMAASRMAYFNAHAAVAAAFLPHNIAGAGGHLAFHGQNNGE